jgi:hypothetical protein
MSGPFCGQDVTDVAETRTSDVGHELDRLPVTDAMGWKSRALQSTVRRLNDRGAGTGQHES